MLISCNNIASLKGTSWMYSTKEGNSILEFSDSTYVTKIVHNGEAEQREFPYTVIGDTIYFPASGSITLKGVIKGDELIIHQSELIELRDTSFTNTYQLVYKKQ